MINRTTQHRFGLALLVLVLALCGLSPLSQAQTTPPSEIEQIRQAIAEKKLSWVPRESPISRLSTEEKLMLLGEEPYTPHIPDLVMFEPPAVKSLPTRLDWRNNSGNWVTPVRDQKGCGSCWAFAATAVFESAFLLQQNTPGVNFDRSEQMVLSCSGAGTCSGGYSYYALRYISETGVADEGCFPYVESDVSCNNRCADWASRSYRGRRVLGAANNVNDIRAALQNGPTTISYDVYTDFYFYGSGVYEYSWGWNMGGHAVTLVGYDNAIQAWLCKNSWGESFGEDGYFWIRWGQVDIGRSVFIIEPNRAPVFSAPDNQVGTVGQPLQFFVRAHDPEGDPVTYSMTSQPAMTGATLNTTSGFFSWTPTGADQGAYSVTFTARDNWNPSLSTTRTITLAVCPASCDDGNPCTTNSCNPLTGQCVPQPILDGEPCTNGDFCVVGESCSSGICMGGMARSCGHLTDTCNVGVCDSVNGTCKRDPNPKEGTPCDDGAACTVNDRCEAGVCVGSAAIDCSNLDDPCNIGVCDISNGSCYKNPIPLNGLACDDGKFCTLNDTCNNGVCAGTVARDCSHVADQCSVGVCNEAHDRCDAEPAPKNGQPCDDGMWCTVNEYCQNGICAYGSLRNCSTFTDQCSVGACDEVNKRCYADPAPKEGTLCDDGRFCTVSERCQNGVCTGGDIRACSSHTDQCNVGACNIATDSCFSDPSYKENEPCNDGLYCTLNETCQSGICTAGEPRDCSHVSDLCNAGVCNEAQNNCVKERLPNGTACDAGVYCTVGQTCQSGACVGGHPRDCSHLDDACNMGLCSNSLNQCYAVSDLFNGAPCSDGLFCTTGDVCQSGTCVGVTPRNCAHVLTTPACQIPHCNEDADICQALPANEGDVCDDGLFCTVDTQCQSGSCLGTPRDCAALMTEPQCQSASCDEIGRRCLVNAANNQQACSTGDFCLVGERCSAGVCTSGQPRDCSPHMTQPQCQTVSCNSLESRCDVLPANEGQVCSNGSFCVVGESCAAGVCQGGHLRDCAHVVVDPQCQAPYCDDVAANCAAAPINEGLACSDGNLCTLEDRCQAGVCQGDPNTCDDGVTCTVDSCNPDTGGCANIPTASLCDNANECTVDTCDAVNDCQHTPKEDWTLCEVGQAILRVCLEAQCTEIRINDRCVGAFPLYEDLIARVNMGLYHAYRTVAPPCVSSELSGPDAFYSFHVETEEALDLVLEYEQGMDVYVIAWDGCETDSHCMVLLESDPETRRVWTPLDPSFAGETLIFQVVAPGHSPGQAGQVTLSLRTEGWEDLDGDVDGDLDDEEETDPTDGDEPDGDEPDGDIIDGDGDGETHPACTPQERTCAGNIVMECRRDGSGWDRVTTCYAPQVCTEGECRDPIDGDQDEPDPLDGDIADGDVPADGDLDPQLPDGDDSTPPDDPTPGTGGGGCQQNGAFHGLWLLLGLLWLAQRRKSRDGSC